MPTASVDRPWIVLRRVVADTLIDDGRDPFEIQAFDGIAQAAARFASMSEEYRAMVLSTMDGKLLVVSLRRPEEPRRRPVAH